MIEFFRRIKAVLFYNIKNERCFRCGRKVEFPMAKYGIKIVADGITVLEQCRTCAKRHSS